MTFIDIKHCNCATNICNRILALSRRAPLRFFHFRFAYISKSLSINKIGICHVLGSKTCACETMVRFNRETSVLEKKKIRSSNIARKLSMVPLTNTVGFENRRKGYPQRACVGFTTIRPLISGHNRVVIVTSGMQKASEVIVSLMTLLPLQRLLPSVSAGSNIMLFPSASISTLSTGFTAFSAPTSYSLLVSASKLTLLSYLDYKSFSSILSHLNALISSIGRVRTTWSASITQRSSFTYATATAAA